MHLERAYCVWSILWLYNAHIQAHVFSESRYINVVTITSFTLHVVLACETMGLACQRLRCSPM